MTITLAHHLSHSLLEALFRCQRIAAADRQPGKHRCGREPTTRADSKDGQMPDLVEQPTGNAPWVCSGNEVNRVGASRPLAEEPCPALDLKRKSGLGGEARKEDLSMPRYFVSCPYKRGK